MTKKKKTKLALGVTAAALVASAIPTQVAPVLAAENDESQSELPDDTRSALDDITQNSSVTATGQEELKVTEFTIDESTKTVPFAEAGVVKFPFSVDTNIEGQVDLLNGNSTLVVNDTPAEFNSADKTFKVEGMTLTIKQLQGNQFELEVQNSTVKSGVYSIQLASGDASLNANLVIESEPAKEYKVLYFDKMASYA